MFSTDCVVGGLPHRLDGLRASHSRKRDNYEGNWARKAPIIFIALGGVVLPIWFNSNVIGECFNGGVI